MKVTGSIFVAAFALSTHALTISGVDDNNPSARRTSFPGQRSNPHPRVEKKAVTTSEWCSEDDKYVVEDLLQLCHQVASAAAFAAVRDVGKMSEYFHTNQLSHAKAVQTTFMRVAQACSSSMHRNDIEIICRGSEFDSDGCSNVPTLDKASNKMDEDLTVATFLDYHGQTHDRLLLCPQFWRFSPLPTSCYRVSQVTTLIHEFTHMRAILGTKDLAYGYKDAVALEREQAMNNADNYALFANTIFLNSFNMHC